MKKSLKKIKNNKYKSMLLISVGCYIILVIAVYFFQRNLQYLPSGSAIPPANFEVKKIITEDDVELLVWQNIPENYKKIIVYFHGNAGNIGDRSYRFETFVKKGYGVVALSYRGYFGSQGKPSEAGFIMDAQAVLKFLKNQNYNKKDLILFGESIGTGVVCHIAQNKIPITDINDYAIQQNLQENLKSNYQSNLQNNQKDNYQENAKLNNNENLDDFFMIILDSPFYSILEIAQRHYWFLPVKFMLKDHFDSYLYSPNITSKTLIFHGDKDIVVPIISGQKLFSTINSKKKFIENRGASHVDTNPEFIIEQIEEFN